MNTKINWKILLLLLGIVAFLYVYNTKGQTPCEQRISYDNVNVNDGINLDSIFSQPTVRELLKVKDDWVNFDIQSDQSLIIYEGMHSSFRNLTVIEHTKEGVTHYGAVFSPKTMEDSKTYPSLVWVNGLDQRNPSVDLKHLRKVIQKFSDYYIIIPSFRGQALVVDHKRYCSDGFFGDAYDGATDDALRFLHCVKSKFDNLDLNRINVCGQSRGGTVAMLMGVRDVTLNSVVSMAGPSRFHNRASYNRFGKQYKYQFLNEIKPMIEIRDKMIKSSPVYFITNIKSNFYLLQGKNDKTVNVSHAQEVIDKIEGLPNFEFLLTEEGHRMNQIKRAANWIASKN